jgi:Tannase and feruloyl esterase
MIRTWMPLAAASMAMLLGCSTPNTSGPVTVGDAGARCIALKGRQLGQQQATITEAMVVAAAPGEPAHCLVKVSLNDSTLRFESRLPLSDWNGRFVALGGGGFKGEVFNANRPLYSSSVLSDRFATMATNGGYDYPVRDTGYFQANFAYDPIKFADYTYLSIHRSVPFAKELVSVYYGRPASRHYFEGCSAGGHEAMMLSQRFPGDFDGIVGRAPAGNFMGLFMQFNNFAKAQRAPGGALNEAKQTLLAKAVLAQCDGQDGLADGILSKPSACRFDVSTLRCAGGADAGDQCLSDAQIRTVQAATLGFSTRDGAWSHPGVNWGAENNRTKGWGEYLWPLPVAPFSGESVATRFSDGFVRSFITRNPNYDTMKWNPDEWTGSLDIVGRQFNAFNPDLSRLRARGGKLILWNGEHDTAVSPRDTARYYDSVVRTMGQQAADQTLELYLAPGVGHCSGGTGPDRIELLRAVVRWVEEGVAPSKQGLVHQRFNAAGQVDMERPACRYPAYPRYAGSGDTNRAASFACTTD